MKLKKIRCSIFLCLAVPILAFAGSTKDITVSAAISLKNAFEEIGRLYESKYGTKCILNFGGRLCIGGTKGHG
jgi:ABC-type molybdate transport system substrate-binding protein